MSQPDAKRLKLEVLSLGSGGLNVEGISAMLVWLADGSWLGLHPGHAPLVTATADGELKYRQDGEEIIVQVRGGILTLKDDTVSILTTH
jgi:F0F1-type ATP synthase epsilon subunit